MRQRIVVIVAIVLIGAAERGTPSHAQSSGDAAYVTRVVAGNAIYAAIADRIEAVRYVGVGVPLIAHPTRGPRPYADLVREMNRRLVDGKWVRLTYDERGRDEQGRLLAYVWVGNVFVNAALLEHGYADVERGAVNTRYAAYFQTLEASARHAGRGLWQYGDVLAYYRARAAAPVGEASNVEEQGATALGGRVFSAPNPITPPTLLPTSSFSSESGAAAAPGRSTGSSGVLPTRPESGTRPQSGTTYMPVPRMR